MKQTELDKIKREAEMKLDIPPRLLKPENNWRQDQRRILALVAEVERLQDAMRAEHRVDRLETMNAEFKLQLLQAENEKLREALRFYADLDNWDTDSFTPTIWDDGDVDCGRVAREALGEGEGDDAE